MGIPVLFTHGIPDLGGAERELLLIVERLEPFGYTSLVVLAAEGQLSREFRERKIRTMYAPLPAWRKFWSLWKRPAAVGELRAVIERTKPRLIHVNDIWWVPQTLRAVRGLGIPVIGHVRQEIEPPKVRRYELDRVDLVLTVSRQIEGSVRAAGVPGDRVRTLYSGLDLASAAAPVDGAAVRRRYGIPPDAVLLGTVANLFPRKGYEAMLKALARLVPSQPSVHYLIVGSGDAAYERVLRSRVGEWGLAGRVHFAGFQRAVFPILHALDLYVQPSLMEGFGIAVVEAMAAGKAVVGTNTGGLPEVIADGETGLLVPPDDDAALAAAIRTLVEDPARRDRFARAGIARATRCFGVDTMMKGLTAAYEAVLSATRPIAAREPS